APPPSEKPADKPKPSADSNPLGLTWVGGGSSPVGGGSSPVGGGNNPVGGTSGKTPVSKPDPEAQRLAQLKTDLLSPLSGVPGPAQGANWKQNDLVNRANLIK